MTERDREAGRFENHRDRLRAVAYRMLGNSAEADDAVQEAWLRFDRAETDDVENLAGWLTRVVGRICLDMLRSRRSRGEEALSASPVREFVVPDDADGPEDAAVRAESVGLALLVVLDRLAPAERVAFVLHDLFAVPFAEIAPVVERSTDATKKLASRARQRVRGAPVVSAGELTRHRHVVDAFLAAARDGDVDALLAVLAPDVVRRADPAALPRGAQVEMRGAQQVADETVALSRNARYAAVALVDGQAGIVVARRGRLALAIIVSVDGDRVAAYEVVIDPDRLATIELGVLDLS